MTDKTLNEALAEAILAAVDTAHKAQDFILAELPDVIQQLLMWKMVESIAMCLLGVVMLSAPPVLAFCAARLFEADIDKNFTKVTIILVGGIVAIFISARSINLDWLQIWIAPKVYLIEYAAGLVK